MKPWLFVFTLMAFKLSAVNFSDFDAYQELYTKDQIERKIKTYLEQNSQIRTAFQLDDRQFSIADYNLRLAASEQKRERDPKPPRSLQGVRIAIDPGHFGGIFAQLEDRYVLIHPITFNEGTLTYLTAVELKNLLEAEGAIVLVSRPGISQGGIEEDFFQWLSRNPTLWTSKEPLTVLFRQNYNREDLRRRAEKINAFQPDLTVIIHYNAHHTPEEAKEGALLTSSNFNLVFVPGAFCKDELVTDQDKYEFLRLLVTDDLEESMKLSRQLTKEFTKQLNVPLASTYSACSMLLEPGIFARNLMLTRLVHSPLCFGETLVQNNEQEYLRLAKEDTEIAGVRCSSRLKEVAKAYLLGIKRYLGEGSDEY